MNGLMLHAGGRKATIEDLCAVPVPAHTDSWRPVAYGDAVRATFEAIEDAGLGPVCRAQYGLRKDGGQMFAVLTIDGGDTADHGLSIGLRQSYDQSLALGVAAGAKVFVCDNLAFSGEDFKIVRKNTTNVWADFRSLLASQIARAPAAFAAMGETFRALKGAPVTEDRGYEVLGLAAGREILTPSQLNVAIGDWRKPRHEAFADRNGWALYNAVTEGLKKGPAAESIDRHAAAHGFLTATILS